MIDLHLHFDGSLMPQTVIDIAKHDGIELKSYNIAQISKQLSVNNDCKSLTEYLKCFDLPLRVLQTKYSINKAFCDLISNLSANGLCYSEIRFAPQLHTNGGLDQRSVVIAAIDAVNRANSECGFMSQLILCCMRGDNNYNQNLETINVAKEFLNKGVCAIDLAGDESHYPTKNYKSLFDIAVKNNIPFTIHAGEAADHNSVADALAMGAARIGHGINSINSNVVLNTLKSQKTVVETCLTSNLQTKAVACKTDFPLNKFLDYGIVATINTDNTTVSGTSLKAEYCKVKNLYSYNDEQMLKIALNAADGAFLNTKQKQMLKQKVASNFNNWINGEQNV